LVEGVFGRAGLAAPEIIAEAKVGIDGEYDNNRFARDYRGSRAYGAAFVV